MGTRFCQRCYARFMARLAQLPGKNQVVDTRHMSFSCKIPIYTADWFGTPLVRIWDCENMQEIRMTVEEYRTRRAAGEF